MFHYTDSFHSLCIDKVVIKKIQIDNLHNLLKTFTEIQLIIFFVFVVLSILSLINLKFNFTSNCKLYQSNQFLESNYFL